MFLLVFLKVFLLVIAFHMCLIVFLSASLFQIHNAETRMDPPGHLRLSLCVPGVPHRRPPPRSTPASASGSTPASAPVPALHRGRAEGSSERWRASNDAWMEVSVASGPAELPDLWPGDLCSGWHHLRAPSPAGSGGGGTIHDYGARWVNPPSPLSHLL